MWVASLNPPRPLLLPLCRALDAFTSIVLSPKSALTFDQMLEKLRCPVLMLYGRYKSCLGRRALPAWAAARCQPGLLRAARPPGVNAEPTTAAPCCPSCGAWRRLLALQLHTTGGHSRAHPHPPPAACDLAPPAGRTPGWCLCGVSV